MQTEDFKQKRCRVAKERREHWIKSGGQALYTLLTPEAADALELIIRRTNRKKWEIVCDLLVKAAK